MDIEKRTKEIGFEILQQTRKQDTKLLNKAWWYGQILSWTMKNDSFKTKIFHFIDVLPSLHKPEDVISHLKEYFEGEDLVLFTSGLGSLAPTLMANTIKKQVHEMAKIFITGEAIEQALEIVPKLRNKNQSISFDILGEATLSKQESTEYQARYLQLMDALIQERENWDKNDLIDKDQRGDVPSINISIKISSLYHHIKEEAWEFSKEKIKEQLYPIFQKAIQNFIFINLDMEHYSYKDLFLEIFQELLMEKEYKTYPHFGIVLQAYLQDSLADAQNLIRFSKKRKQIFSIRLVKGAYWDSEVLLAKQKDWPIPVYTIKEETDANFENIMKLLFENHKFVKLAIGSHNARSIAKALALHEQYPQACLEFQTLYGMGESLSEILIQKKYPVRLYSTIGELIPGMSYLVRRLLENTSNQSFIRSALSQNQSKEKLLAAPKSSSDSHDSKSSKGSSDSQNSQDTHDSKSLKNSKNSKKQTPQNKTEVFQNYPVLDFSIASNREKFQKHLNLWNKKFPITVPVVINGKQEKSSSVIQRENPSKIKQIVSEVHYSDISQAEKAVQSTHKFFETWKQTPAQQRIDCLEKLASLMKQKEFELASLQVFEVGKTWVEAHADVCEAIDFCSYYAKEFKKITLPKKTCEISGEESLSSYEAIGVAAVIAPWNFPFAILTGMTVAPLVCGNTVIIKPAEQSSLIAYQLASLLLESGFPKESFAFLPGAGEVVGDHLVTHPLVPIISFTGSFEVGLQIIQKAPAISHQHKHFKKVIAEMGGKNSIIVDLSADLDEAISGILTSAFSFQGQKCSACSRVIIVEDIYDRFIKRFLPAVKSLIMDQSENPKTYVGPVVDQQAYNKMRAFIDNQNPQSLIYQGTSLEGGWFIPPTVFTTDDPQSPLMQEEFFAPILALFKVKNFDEAIKQSNDIRYGLTAGLYSRKPSHIKKFKTQIEVGNAYINRNCTGALVQRHPFGGRKMSGLGNKAGGPEYLTQFLHTKITTENTMRRGFAPEIFDEDFLDK